jgi:hypothetical protein
LGSDNLVSDVVLFGGRASVFDGIYKHYIYAGWYCPWENPQSSAINVDLDLRLLGKGEARNGASGAIPGFLDT